MSSAATKPDLPVLAFESAAAWRRWLSSHHTSSAGVWVRFFKKGSGVPTVTYSEAVDEALCFGWIDSQAKRFDEQSYLQRFSPRRRRSLWSKINITRVEKLTAAKRMRAAGLKEVEAAKADGRWERAYEPPSRLSIPDDFREALAKNKKAQAFFATLNRANLYAVSWRLATAKKPETRARRIAQLIEMFSRGERVH
jgi:uncharacterized protein YdeI (YjbR/CyaY-like superfamily)